MKSPTETILASTVAEHIVAFRCLCTPAEQRQIREARSKMRDVLKSTPGFTDLEDYQILSMFIEEFADFASFVSEENQRNCPQRFTGKVAEA
jgi:tellurite resistance protein